MHFGQNSYFQAITHQIKAFKISLNVINRINKVRYKFCSIRINVAKYDVAFAAKRDSNPSPPNSHGYATALHKDTTSAFTLIL